MNREPDFETPEIKIWVVHEWEVPEGVSAVVKTRIPSVVLVFSRREKGNAGRSTEPKLVA